MATLVHLKNKNKNQRPYAVRWKTQDGKTKQESFETRAAALLFRSQKNVEQASERKRKPRRTPLKDVPTFETVASAYLANKEFPKRGDPLEPITLRVYRSYLQEHVDPHLKNVLITAVTREHFERVYDMGKLVGNSRKTLKESLRIMTAVLKYAYDSGFIDSVPTHGIDTRPTKKEKIRERLFRSEKTYTPDEVYTMLHAADSLALDDNKQLAKVWERYRPMVYFLVYTGARISEARGFPRKGLAAKYIKIMQSAPEKGASGYVKTADGVRDIPLHPILEGVLKPYLSTHKRSLVFGTANDKPISNSNLYSRLLDPLKDRADALAAKGSDPRYVRVNREPAFHAFRHHYASRLVQNGANLKELQTLMGHASAAMTLDVYAHLFEGDQTKLVTSLII